MAARARSAFSGVATALTLGACGLDVRYDAAEDVRAFLVAAQEGDEAAFERRIDREALRESIKADLERSGGHDTAVLTRFLSGRQGDAALDRMITPESFRVVAQGAGAGRIPSRFEIAAGLRLIGPDRACLRDGRTRDSCALTFERRDDGWKLVTLEPADVQVETEPAPG